MATPHSHQRTVGLLITQGHWGGAQRYVFDLATSLAHEMRIVVGVGSPNRGKELQERITHWNSSHPEAHIHVEQLTYLVREISPWNDIRALSEIQQFVQRNQVEILHCNSAKAAVLGSFATLAHRVRRVITVHGFTSTEPLSWARRTLYRTLERFATRSADLVICPDLASYGLARDAFHVDETKLAHIPHTISALPFFSRETARKDLAQRTGFPITDRTRIVGSIANLYRVKNHALLLESFAELARTDDRAICIVVGDGNERPALEAQRARLSCADRIFFVGAFENAAVLLRGFDVFALTSDKEGYPYVLLEARAAGTPIVARAVGGCPELLEGSTAAIVLASTEPASIARALATAMDLPHTPSPLVTRELMHDATRVRYEALVKL